jgi:predicted transcriptional regulator
MTRVTPEEQAEILAYLEAAGEAGTTIPGIFEKSETLGKSVIRRGLQILEAKGLARREGERMIPRKGRLPDLFFRAAKEEA